ncbi:MAG: hypothetical protein HYY84_10865 [Deltaproteobacteria bacterium]|nr:hypothetical protein [Deltaproteobacteria bacterium]
MMRGRRFAVFALLLAALSTGLKCTGLKSRLFGVDAGADAGAGDAGIDGGTDAGIAEDPKCDAGVKPLGCGCTSETECDAGNCTDGVCCNENAINCFGCRRCDGDNRGTCVFVSRGDDPKNYCAENPQSCAAGVCDGNGGCAPVDAGVSCGPASCMNLVAVGQYSTTASQLPVCDGITSSYCPVASSFPCADGGTCGDAGTCRTTCGVDADCVQGFYCAGDAGCAARKSNNSDCDAGNECQSNVCTSSAKCADCDTHRDCSSQSSSCISNTRTCGTCSLSDLSCVSAGFGYCNTSAFPIQCACTPTNGAAPCTNARAPFCPTFGGLCTCGSTGLQCTRASGNICTSTGDAGVCKVAPQNPCVSSSDCASDACDAGRCGPVGTGSPCRYNADCAAGGCDSGICG